MGTPPFAGVEVWDGGPPFGHLIGGVPPPPSGFPINSITKATVGLWVRRLQRWKADNEAVHPSYSKVDFEGIK